jgi:hypothetical protein
MNPYLNKSSVMLQINAGAGMAETFQLEHEFQSLRRKIQPLTAVFFVPLFR